MTQRAPLIVGIDLGTTHTVVAWTDPNEQSPARIFPIPQLIAHGQVAERALLPSFLYAPHAGEPTADAFGDAPWIIGEHARARGREVPARLVASAKSWLCHAGVDRGAPILPWGASEDSDVPRLSPVEASTRVLRHVRATWNAAFPKQPLEKQQVILTVPASFDEVARELTVLAAEAAGLSVRLLEEPQAAFYDYVAARGTAELEAVLGAAPETLALICDVGGGTTDLTLIRIARSESGEISLARTAVGRHLLLGGDNIDLALAHLCEQRLVSAPERLDHERFGQLVLACRNAKERLLSEDAPEEVPIRLLRAGSSLVGSTLSTELSRAEVERTVLDGFLPIVTRGTKTLPRRSGLLAFGLPYEHDAAITRHVSEFLERYVEGNVVPRALLLNGGLFRAAQAAERLTAAISEWSAETPTRLAHSDPDLAVARGAVAYGLALLGRGIKIEGGTAHGYYVAVEARENERALGICVVPRGAREGEQHIAASRPLALRLGIPVRFELYASDFSEVHAPGQLVELDEQRFSKLPPLVTSFDAVADSSEPELEVVLEGELTPVGTVELSCIEARASVDSRKRFRLAFDLRRAPEPSETKPSQRRPSSIPQEKFGQAREAIERVFGKGRKDVKARESKDLVRELERILGERADWTSELNRALVDVLLPLQAARKRSADHERVFWMLSGYLLRPGFGHPKDPERVQSLVALFDQGLTFSDESRGWQQFFIAWRRIAGGLDENAQIAMRNLLDPFLAPDDLKLKRPKNWKPQARDELLELASWLERVPAEGRAQLGRWLLDRTWTDRDPRIWGAIGRIGARVPMYASVHYVVAKNTVERWLDHLLREKWTDVSSAPRAAMQLARVTGDRTRDISETLRAEIVRELERAKAPAEWITMVREFVPVEESERRTWFEDLPVGLRLV